MSSHGGLRRVVNIEDLRKMARGRAPRAIFDYLDGGADDELTLRSNQSSWAEVLFRPRNAVHVKKPNLSTSILGSNLALPIILAPIGFSRLMHPDGERAVAQAISAEGIGFLMSSFSGHPCEHVAAAAGTAPLWYQLYLAGGREVAEATFARVWKAGFRALAVTIDTNCPGNRERDFHNSAPQLMSGRLGAMLPYLPGVLRHPLWLARFLADRDALFFPNIQIPGRGALPASDVREVLSASVITWSDLKWIRTSWPGPIVAKGIITGEDANRALDEGCDALIVSNHGGRQLDSCLPTVRALPDVLRAINGRAPVLVDGGIRRGGDILKAIALGAKAVLIGRAYAYGLMAAGRDGVSKSISILQADLERTMVLLGCESLSDLNESYVHFPKHW